MAIYYVDVINGLDTNVGSEAEPWKTVAKVSATNLLAGDTVKFHAGQTWNEGLDITEDGASGNEITFTMYSTGDRPIFTDRVERTGFAEISSGIWEASGAAARLQKNGQELVKAVNSDEWDLAVTEWVNSAVLGGSSSNFRIKENPSGDTYMMATSNQVSTIQSSTHLIFNQLDFQGGYSRALRVDDCTDIQVNECNIGTYAQDGINVYNSSNITVDGNSLDSLMNIYYDSWAAVGGSYRGNQDGISVAGNCANVMVTNNNCKNWQHASIALSSATTDNIKILYNYCEAPDLSYGGRIAWSGSGVTGVECAYNHIKDTAVQNQFMGHHNHIHHNIFEGIRNTPLKADNQGNAFELSPYNGDVNDNLYENNIAINCDGAMTKIEGYNSSPPNIYDNIIRNNISYNCGLESIYGKSNIGIYVTVWDDNYRNTFMNNLVYSEHTSTPFYHASIGSPSNASDFNAENGSNQDVISGNIDTNPLFVDLVNFILGVGSPAIGTGLVPTATEDYVNNTITDGGVGTGYDIGIYNQGYTGAIMTGITEIRIGFSQAILDAYRNKCLALYA